jgi:hypothetical protein
MQLDVVFVVETCAGVQFLSFDEYAAGGIEGLVVCSQR